MPVNRQAIVIVRRLAESTSRLRAAEKSLSELQDSLSTLQQRINDHQNRITLLETEIDRDMQSLKGFLPSGPAN